MYVSVSAYNDADVLDGCLASIREFLPDAEVVVIDGKYETWPTGANNSTDATPEVAQRHDAGYVPAGPFEREVNKHRFRVGTAPDEERVLMMDADERLIHFRPELLPEDRPVQPRIFNAVVYSSTPVSYWPRMFFPESVQQINRWDAYIFDAAPVRCDGVTIYHRHDLRDESYRREKYARFENEGRVGRYEKVDERKEGTLEAYYRNELDVDPDGECPECGAPAVFSPWTNHRPDGLFTQVRACLVDGCWAELEEMDVDSYDYLPDRVEEGLREDPERLRYELVDAGCKWLREMTGEYVRDHAPIVMAWVREHEDELREGA